MNDLIEGGLYYITLKYDDVDRQWNECNELISISRLTETWIVFSYIYENRPHKLDHIPIKYVELKDYPLIKELTEI